ncbi:MAG TPA: LuxR C-terminal-related transcriptional regulator [Kineosporiaceae bacterium]
MTVGDGGVRPPVTVIVGVDGAGRSHRLAELIAVIGADAVRVGAGSAVPDLMAELKADGGVLVVDDAHRLPAALLGDLVPLAESGVPMVLARRPTVTSPQLAELDAVLAGRGTVEVLHPLDEAAVAELLGVLEAHRTAEVLAASCGHPAVAAALAAVPRSELPAPLVARVQRAVARLDPVAQAVGRALALRLDLADDVLAAIAGASPAQAARAVAELREAGFIDPGGEGMIPAVADVVTAGQPAAQLRLLHDTVARALLRAGGDVLPAALRMRAVRLRTPAAAEIYLTAGRRLRFDDPVQAMRWLDDAVDAGLDPRQAGVVRAETGLLLGLLDDLDAAPDAVPQSTDRSGEVVEWGRRVEGVHAAHQGRAGRAADLLSRGGPLGRLLAVPSLVAVGRLDEARRSAEQGEGPPAVRRLAEAALAVQDPARAVPLLIEAAETLGRGRLGTVLPDAPQALAAPVAVLAGDASTADALLGDAIDKGLGGPAGVHRHRLLLSWVRLRAGRFDTAVSELSALGATARGGRDRLLVAALEAGLARRSGDIGRLRDGWARAEPVLARRAVDLLQLELLEELLCAATRVRQAQRVDPILADLDDVVSRLGRPVAWDVALGWLNLQLGIAADDAGAVLDHAHRLQQLRPTGIRQRAQCAAAAQWAMVMAGRVDAEGLSPVLDDLAAYQLPWEASRLAGQAAIRTTDPGVARRLLERARELSSAEVQLDSSRAVTPASGLSERELEVAQLVAAGRTHREIGGQLFLSPKTVEHHVARIRNKLGATNRAEFLAALRDILGEEPATR